MKKLAAALFCAGTMFLFFSFFAGTTQAASGDTYVITAGTTSGLKVDNATTSTNLQDNVDIAVAIQAIESDSSGGTNSRTIQFGDGTNTLDLGVDGALLVSGNYTLTGKLTCASPVYAVCVSTTGTVTVNADIAATGTYGSAVFVYGSQSALKVESGTLTAVSGSVIYNNSESANALTVSGGTVSATGAEGIGINNRAGGTVAVSGGTVRSACTNENSAAIYNYADGTINISGGTVRATDDSAKTRAVYNAGAGSVNISGGSLSVDTTLVAAAVVYNADSGAVSVSGTGTTITATATVEVSALTSVMREVFSTEEPARLP